MSKQLTNDLNHLTLKRNVNIEKLGNQLTQFSNAFLYIKKQLQIDLKKDEKKIQKLTTISNYVVNNLYKLLNKGKQILFLMKICQKLETEREQIVKFEKQDEFELEEIPASENVIEDVKFQKKEDNKLPDFLQPIIDSLNDLDEFWKKYSRIQVDIIDIKQEKNFLLNENKELRTMLRGVLESVALEKGKIGQSTRAQSKTQSFRRILLT